MAQDINIGQLAETLNDKADIDLNNTGVFTTDGGKVSLVQSTSPEAKEKEVASADFSLKQGGLELMDVVFAPLGIDETKNKRRYLNGQVIIQSQFPAFTAAVKARMTTMTNAFTTETNWQAEKTHSKLGQCGKFVVDDTAGTIRLPCVVNAQGMVDLALIGGIKSESLPNITGTTQPSNTVGFRDDAMQGGAFYLDKTTELANYPQPSSEYKGYPLKFDTSRLSSVYQDNAPCSTRGCSVSVLYCG